jgi:hypothetical protein
LILVFLFVLLCSEMNEISKTNHISDTEQLLQLLASEGVLFDDSRFHASYSVGPGVKPELRLEYPGGKTHWRVVPVLSPTRSLFDLGWAEVGEGLDILVSPHISDALAADLRREAIAHADLNGRFYLVDDERLIDVRPSKTKYRSARVGADLFSPKASRIVHRFLTNRDVEFTQDKLTAQTQVSRALVSQVLKQLVSERLVKQLNQGNRKVAARYQLINFDRLLDLWVSEDKWLKRVKIYQFSVLGNDPDVSARKLQGCIGAENLAFTQWIAAWQRRPYTTPVTVSAYLKNPELLSAAPGRPVQSGGNVWLIVPKDEGVWQNSQEAKGLPLVSDIQIYLDLLQVGLRGPDAADELRAWEGFTK